MSLRSKTLVILVGVFALYAALDFGVQRYVLFPSFLAIERTEAEKDINRCKEALLRECRHLDRLCQDWAAWDDAYKFVSDRNEAFIKSCLPVETFKECRLNRVYFLNSKDQLVWGGVRETKSNDLKVISNLPDDSAFKEYLAAFKKKGGDSGYGIASMPEGPMIVAARQIVPSDQKGPTRGTLVMGQLLEEDIIARLREQTCVDFNVWPFQGGQIPENETAVAVLTSAKSDEYLMRDNPKTLSIFAFIPDVAGTPVLLMRADIPRTIIATGNTAERFALVSILGIGLIVSLVVLFFLQHVIVSPISRLTRHVMAVAGSKNLSLRIPLEYDGEIGTLAREFNNMLQELSHTRQKLLEQSYHTGLAEMAKGTLDHIHKALDPLMVQVEDLRKDLTSQGEVHEVEHLENVAFRASQIRDILAEHERFGQVERLIEDIPLDTLVRDSTSLVPDNLLQAVSVEMDFEPSKTPAVRGYRILLLQVFANLFTNAAESIQRRGSIDGKINIEVGFEQQDGKDLVHVRFIDNGNGIDRDKLTAIFDRMHTSKSDRGESSFLGLHWCAKTLATMGGRIFAESEGPGQGACLHVILPAGQVLISEAGLDVEVSEVVE